MNWKYVDSRASKFNYRLWRLIEVSQHEMDPSELAQFMEEPDSSLNGISPWDCFAAVSDAEFEQICDHLRAKIATKKAAGPPGKEPGVTECAVEARLSSELPPSRPKRGT